MLSIIVDNRIEGMEGEGITGLDKKPNVMDVEGEGVMAPIEPSPPSQIEIQPSISYTEQRMMGKGVTGTRKEKVKLSCHPPPVLTTVSGHGNGDSGVSGDMNGKTDSDVPNLLYESLPFTRCKIVLNVWEEEETENFNQGWRREESGFVFYEGITTREKEEFQKLLPIVKGKGEMRDEQPSKMAVFQKEFQAELIEKLENRSVGNRTISQNKSEIKCISHTRDPDCSISGTNEMPSCLSSNLIDTPANPALSVNESPNKQSVLVEEKPSIITTPTNVDETNPRRSSQMDLIYRCPYCFKTFLEAGSLIDHLPLHSGPKVNQVEQKERKIEQIAAMAPPSIGQIGSSKRTKKLGVKALNSPESENKAKYRPHKCNHCDQSFQTFRNLRVHEGRRHKGLVPNGPTLHKCLYCKYSYHSLIHVKNHMKLHTEEGRPFKCNECGCAFKFNRFLQLHITRFHNPIKVQKKKSSLRLKNYQPVVTEPIHQSNFETSKPILKEPNSQVEVINGAQPDISQNVEDAPSNKIPQNLAILKLTRCDNLLKQYGLLPGGSKEKSMKDLGVEVKTSNQLENSNTTQMQQKNALSRENIEMIKSDDGSNKWKCKICEKVLLWSRSISRHLKLHVGLRRLVCTYCQMTFSRKGNLNAHVKNAHENNATTEQQSQPKPSSHSKPLRKQLLKSLAPGWRPKCTYCQKEFKYPSSLRRHVKMIHLGMKSLSMSSLR